MRQSGLLITNEFPPYPGGIGVYSYQIALNLAKLNIPVVVATPGPMQEVHYQAADEFDRRQPFPIYRLQSNSSSLVRYSQRVAKIFELCREYNVGWILCGSPHAFKFAILCKYRLGIPYFVVGHGSEYLQSSWLQQALLWNAAGFFANSAYTGRLMESVVNRPVHVIPLGADHCEYDPGQVSAQTVDYLRTTYAIDGDPILVSIGRLNQRKGHHVTLAALPTIKERFPKVQLVIVGRSVEGAEEYEASLRRFVVERSLEANTRFIAKLPLDQLRALYALADLSILSSMQTGREVEGFGIVIIEANLMGKAVVAARSGGMIDAVEDGKSGFLYTCGDESDLAQKALALLDDDNLRQAMAQYGRERALNSYTWEVVTNNTWKRMLAIIPKLESAQ